MKTKNLSLIFVCLLAISLVSAATTTGTLSVGTGGDGQIIINPGYCEDWSGSNWGSCIDGSQTFICFDKNSCQTTVLRPALCGQTRSCSTTNTTETTTNPPVNNGGSSGGSPGGNNNNNIRGGGSGSPAKTKSLNSEAVCVEKWQCSDWSNSNDQCGTRTCEDANNCETTQLKPEVSLKCSKNSGFLGITGLTISGISSFAKTTTGKGIIVVIALIVVLGLIFSFRKIKGNKSPSIKEFKVKK